MRNQQFKPIENPLPVSELLARAAAGDADCQYWAGLRYFQADGVPESRRQAVELCRQAADQGHVRALAFLAYCHHDGIVLPRNLKESVRCYRLSAAGGYAPALHTLGMFYLSGRGVRKNVRTGIRLLKQAAAQGLAGSCVELGRLYRAGQEVVADDEEACRWFSRAAELGDVAGQFHFGGMLFGGHGVGQDVAAALELLDLSAAQGHDGALQMKAHMAEFVVFDPRESGLTDCPVAHSFPLRRRTVHLLKALGRVSWPALAEDLIEFAKEHPKDEEAAIEDAARLLTATGG